MYVEIKGPAEHDRPSNAHYSGFSHDGFIRSHEALRLLPAIQWVMLAEARLELNLYNLLRRRGETVGAWIGGSLQPSESVVENPCRIDEALAAAKKVSSVFREVAGWLRVDRHCALGIPRA